MQICVKKIYSIRLIHYTKIVFILHVKSGYFIYNSITLFIRINVDYDKIQTVKYSAVYMNIYFCTRC
jgi:hypothetical protein